MIYDIMVPLVSHYSRTKNLMCKHLGVIHLSHSKHVLQCKEYLWQSSWGLPSLKLFCTANKILLTKQCYLVLRFNFCMLLSKKHILELLAKTLVLEIYS